MSDPANWTTKAEWMRTVRATDAAWSEYGELLSLKLDAALPAPSVTSEDHPVKPRSADARAQYEVDERRRVALGASGGPVRRLSAKD